MYSHLFVIYSFLFSSPTINFQFKDIQFAIWKIQYLLLYSLPLWDMILIQINKTYNWILSLRWNKEWRKHFIYKISNRENNLYIEIITVLIEIWLSSPLPHSLIKYLSNKTWPKIQMIQCLCSIVTRATRRILKVAASEWGVGDSWLAQRCRLGRKCNSKDQAKVLGKACLTDPYPYYSLELFKLEFTYKLRGFRKPYLIQQNYIKKV